MWDYDKLFAEGNIIGIKNCYRNKVYNTVVDESIGIYWLEGYKNKQLCLKEQYVDDDSKVKHGYTTDFEIQYVVRLDEHGNVAEKLFDRDRDMPGPMPDLETGMFIRVLISGLGFVDSEHNHVIYQTGGYDFIDNEEDICGIASSIVEVYSKNTYAFEYCNKDNLIWRSSEYQSYLDSKN